MSAPRLSQAPTSHAGHVGSKTSILPRQETPGGGQVRLDSSDWFARAAASVRDAIAEEWPVALATEAVLQAVQGQLNAEHGFVYILDEDGATMTLKVGTGLFSSLVGAHCGPKTGLAGKVWASGAAVNIEDYENWTGRGIEIQAEGARCLVALPVRAGNEVLAVVGLAHSRSSRRFPRDVETRVEGLLALLAIHLLNDDAIDRARVQHVEREFVERELQQLRAEEQHVLDLVPASIWVKDRENRIVRANAAAAARMGLTVEEMEGQFLWELDPENAASSYRRDLEVLESGEAQLAALEETTEPGGERRWWKVDRAPIADALGVLSGVVVVSRDVTAEHLAETRLEASRLATEQANRVKDNYIATMSHDVRAPLDRMMGVVDRLLHSDLPMSARPQVEALYTSVDTLLTLVQDVLDFSRAEAGSLAIEVHDFEVRGLLEDVLEVMAQVAHQKGVQLASHVDARVPQWVAGDSNRVRQVLVQMLAAAMRSAHGGEILVTAQKVMATGDAVELRFEICSTTPNMEAREVERLFEPFRSESMPPAEDGRAADFGLALASRLVELLRGKIGVETDPEEGLRCWCTLGLSRAQARESDLVTVSLPRPGARILVVDDSPMVSVFLQQQLSEMRMLVDAASGIDQALQMVEAARRDEWPYELCLVDDDLAGKPGRDLVDRLRAAEFGRETPCVLIVPFGHPLPEGEMERLDLADVMTRPVRNLRLRDVLRRCLGPADGEEASFEAPANATLSPGSAPRVLLVEEQRQEQKLLAFALRRMGCEVHLANTAAEAVERVREDQYDLVLLDDDLPWSQGLGTVDRIRRVEAGHRHTTVVAMVRRPDRDTQERCLAAGMDGCLAKPPSFAELRGLLADRMTVPA